MAELHLARKLLTKLRHVPNPTPAKLLTEFRRLSRRERRRLDGATAAEEVPAWSAGRKRET